MGAYGNIPISSPATSGGVPQYFTKGGDQSSWFPGAPQYNMGLGSMLSQYGQFNPQYNALQAGFSKYGTDEQRGMLSQGSQQYTGAVDQLAGQYGANTDPTLNQGIQNKGGSVAQDSNYAAGRMGANQITAQAQEQASQVPGQIDLAKQQVQQQYRQNQINSLKQMVDIISSAAGSQYGYQGAQLGADAGQISLANAQNREQSQNMGSLMSLITNGPMSLLSPSTFYGGGGSGGSGGSSGPLGLNNMMNAWMNGAPDFGGPTGAGDTMSVSGSAGSGAFGSALSQSSPMFFG